MSNKNLTTGRIAASILSALAGLASLPTLASAAETRLYTAVFRDFRAANVSGGHPDFERNLPNGRAVYAGIAADSLNTIGDPTLASTGRKVAVSASDQSGRPIIGSKPYLLSRPGDSAATSSSSEGLAVESAYSFSQWYNETVAARLSALVRLPFEKTSGRLLYDGTPRNDMGGVTGSDGNKNWGYTLEFEMDFAYSASRNDWIRCGADDCMWVYIDNRLVIDLGGAHDYAEQHFDLNRLVGLQEGERYSMKVFFAERQKSESRMRIETTMDLNGVAPPPVSGQHD